MALLSGYRLHSGEQLNTEIAATSSAAASAAASAVKGITGPTTPASATATGTIGTVVWDTGFIYVCTATNTWKRVAIATW